MGLFFDDLTPCLVHLAQFFEEPLDKSMPVGVQKTRLVRRFPDFKVHTEDLFSLQPHIKGGRTFVRKLKQRLLDQLKQQQ